MGMNLVYIKCSYDVIELSNFWRKLKRFVGDFKIEAQTVDDAIKGYITISFYSDIPIEEGKSRQVDIEARRNAKGSWYFTKINQPWT